MSRETKFSDELLNALVDEQLTAQDAERVYASMQHDVELRRRVCELRALRQLVRLAYSSASLPAQSKRTSTATGTSYWRVGVGLVAGVTLTLSGLLIWENREDALTLIGHHLLGGNTQVAARAQSAPAAARTLVKVLFHLNTDDRARMGETLDEVEGTLKFYRQTGQNARVEVVANGSGLDLLRVDASPYPYRVQRMLQDFDNLKFVACQNTIDRLKRERGIIARLLPGVVVIDSGVAEIMRRQQEGWAYIRV